MNVERTHKRDLSYSEWHRTLGSDHYASDLDWIEYTYHYGKVLVVALIETKYGRARMSDTQKDLLLEMSKLSNKPVYCVWYNYKTTKTGEKVNWTFRVMNLRTGAEKDCSEKEYRAFLKELRTRAKTNV